MHRSCQCPKCRHKDEIQDEIQPSKQREEELYMREKINLLWSQTNYDAYNGQEVLPEASLRDQRQPRLRAFTCGSTEIPLKTSPTETS